ncbi:MAG TPA: proteasome activator [Egibacteraceae bacterium]|nr:proteasome activator [Egibacteraceae bacterium]
MPDEIEVVGPDPEPEASDGQSEISEPGKLLRIAVMLRELQEEVRRAAPDQASRERLRVIHERAVEAMSSVLSDDLREELSHLTLPFEEGTPTESELLISHAQLIGWLEGLFQGIQAAIFSQQMQARHQLEQMRNRGLPPGARPPPSPGQPGEGPPAEQGRFGTGQYL